MLGIYSFNDIIFYLQDNQLHKIYDIDYLEKVNNTRTKHILYQFEFNHDYIYNDDGKITNYDLVKKRFQEKIRHYEAIYVEDTMNVFITFTDNVNNLNIEGFLELFRNKIKFHLIIFTYNHFNPIPHTEYISVIKLNHDYNNWFIMNHERKHILYKEIFDTFIETLKTLNIEHDFKF